MWHLQKIPKILHTYWGGGKLSYLRYLTLESFHLHNPDWEIRFYFPTNPIKERSWRGVEQKYKERWEDWTMMIDTNIVKVIGVPWEQLLLNNMSEVHRSDYFRLTLLAGEGGLWADLDILFFRPIDALAINTPANAEKNTVVSLFSYGHSIGFMMASPNNPTFTKLRDMALKLYDPNDYQCMGAELFNKMLPSMNSIPDGVDVGMEAVYLYNCTQIKHIFGNTPSPESNPHAIGTHWYAGSAMAGEFLYRTYGGVTPDDSLIGRLIQNHERNIHKDIQG